MTIGFIGLGIMGKPMAKNLLKAGYTVKAFDVVQPNLEDVVSAGAEKSFSPKDAAETSDVIITMLPNSPHVKEVVFEKIKPVLNVMGGSVTLVGEIGSGNVTKLANQIMVAGNIASMAEALTLATKAGVNPERVFNAVKGGLAGSTVLNAKAPMVLERNFKP